MNKGLEIVFHGFTSSDAIETEVRKRITKLEHICDDICGCRVCLDKPHNHHHKGTHYRVSVDVSLPGGAINVHNEKHDKSDHTDLYIAIRDAFNVAQRKLKKLSQVQRPSAKQIMHFTKSRSDEDLLSAPALL